MALAGKELGTDVGCWFGPSIAAGAIKYVYSHPSVLLLAAVLTRIP
jgi:cysteine protease ATG4